MVLRWEHVWRHLWLVSSWANYRNACWLRPHADLGFGGAISTTYSSFGPVMKSLTRFIDHMNSFHRTIIKFTSEYSTTETHFPPTNDSSIPLIQHGMFRCTSRCVLPARNISWSRTPSKATPLVPTTRSGPHYLYYFEHNLSDILQDMWYSVYR